MAANSSSSTKTALSLRSFRHSWITSMQVSHGSHASSSLLYRGCDSRLSHMLQRIYVPSTGKVEVGVARTRSSGNRLTTS
jgi:hypothetical protein